jgi:hypothetical protein
MLEKERTNPSQVCALATVPGSSESRIHGLFRPGYFLDIASREGQYGLSCRIGERKTLWAGPILWAAFSDPLSRPALYSDRKWTLSFFQYPVVGFRSN